jgi:hypothetical protein
MPLCPKRVPKLLPNHVMPPLRALAGIRRAPAAVSNSVCATYSGDRCRLRLTHSLALARGVLRGRYAVANARAVLISKIARDRIENVD